MPNYTLWLQARGVGADSPVREEGWLMGIFDLACAIAILKEDDLENRRQHYRSVFRLLEQERKKLSKRTRVIKMKLPLRKFHKVEDVLQMRKWVGEQEKRNKKAKRLAKGLWLSGIRIPKLDRPYRIEQLREVEGLFRRKGGLYREVQLLNREYRNLLQPVPEWSRPYQQKEIAEAKRKLKMLKQMKRRFKVSDEAFDSELLPEDLPTECEDPPTEVTVKDISPPLKNIPESKVSVKARRKRIPIKNREKAREPDEAERKPSREIELLKKGLHVMAVILLFPFRYLLSLWWLFLIFGFSGGYLGWHAANFCFPDLNKGDFVERLKESGLIRDIMNR